MILTCGDWFFNKMKKSTMQADIADLGQDWIEPTPLLVGDLEKNGFNLNKSRFFFSPFFCRKLGAYDRDNKWVDIAFIEVSHDLTHVSVYSLLDKEAFRELGALYNPKGLQVHELQQLLRLCGYADIADNFQL